MRPCTDEDYAKFYPADGDQRNDIEQLKKKRAFMCIENLEAINLIGGSYSEEVLSFLTVRMNPC